MREISVGCVGDDVRVLQCVVGAQPDGIFGVKTENDLKVWQSAHGLTADGIAGVRTWTKMCDTAPVLRVGCKGKYVQALEYFLETMQKDGVFCANELAHVKTYQTAQGLDADGIVGEKTWERLFGLTSKATDNAVKPKDFKQYDSKWGSIMFSNHKDKGQTIRNSGCGPTSMADIIATWWDPSITPKQTAADVVANGYRTYNSGTSWGYFKSVALKYKAAKFVQTSSFETMRGCLADGGYVVVSFGKSKWTNGGHYCCLWKDDGKYIYVNDPASAASSRAKGTYSEIKAAAKCYFCFWR